jgi:hypothetical protein
MVTEELLVTFDTLNYQLAKSIGWYIVKLHHSWAWVPAGIFLDECLKGVENAINTFDNTKGLLRGKYVEQRIRYTLQEYKKRTTLHYQSPDYQNDEIDDVDLSVYTDREIHAIAMVLDGNATATDRRIVKKLFKVGEYVK